MPAKLFVIVIFCITLSVKNIYALHIDFAGPVAPQISATDSLQDVFPDLSVKHLAEGRVSSCLVDGPQGNMVILTHDQGPVKVTWDLAPNQSFVKAQLDKVCIWMLGSDWGNYDGRLLISRDGKVFTPIPHTRAEHAFGQSDKANLVQYTFKPGEVTNFRFLRLESFGYKGQHCRILEIDGWISGIKVLKSTAIRTQVNPLAVNRVTFHPPEKSQSVSPPMQVHPLRFAGTNLVLTDTGRNVMNLQKLFTPPDKDWKMVSRKLGDRNLSCEMRHKDGLTRKFTLDIDDKNLLSFDCRVEGGTTPVNFKVASFDFEEADIRFDGITFGSVPSYLGRGLPTTVEIGPYIPYFIFPNRQHNIEVQFYMPDWYDAMGRINIFAGNGKSLITWEMFGAARNSRAELETPKNKLSANRWNETERVLKPGEKLNFHLNIGVFSITPRTLGQMDIEEAPVCQPITWIDTGTPGQQAQGIPTVLQRDKMIFMGFILPEPAGKKIGHSTVDAWDVLERPKMVERLSRAGVGLVILMAQEYIDVSHGVSLGGKYDQSPPGLDKLLNNLQTHGIKPVWWFSPRGFLNKPWLGRPKDRMVEEHPDWFLKDAHWYGNYQTLDTFKEPGNLWVVDKLKQDLTRFPELKGFAFDSFPWRSTVTGGQLRETLTRRDQYWLKTFSRTIHNLGPENILIANGSIPLYDDYLYYDYTVSENSVWMFLNEVTAGHVPFGRPYVAHEQWGQLYNWYVTLANMYYNFCDYDQGLGWMHTIWLGWQEEHVRQARKPVDEQVIPLWFLMGKGERIYSAQISPKVRQIEAKMPDGSITVIVASMSPNLCNIQVVPQTVIKDKYRIISSIDTCLEHRDLPKFETDLKNHPGFEMKNLPPFSISVFKFIKE
jgi:hypothetical protein